MHASQQSGRSLVSDAGLAGAGPAVDVELVDVSRGFPGLLSTRPPPLPRSRRIWPSVVTSRLARSALFSFRVRFDARGEVSVQPARSHYLSAFSGVTSITTARSRIHSSSVIGLSEMMYLPVTCSICQASRQCAGSLFLSQKI